jgi:3-hydroxyisobutyrate dehydrogenase-like beta-hydroxyacid dehydrogenase
MYQELIKKEKKLAVIGLGYVGLPIALEFAKNISVIGFDINKSRIIGFALSSQTSGGSVTVRKGGSVDGFVGLTENVRVFLAPSGGVTQTAPTGASESIVQLGVARSSTRIDIDIQQLVRRA